MNLEILGEHTAAGLRSDRARARCMMTPGVIANELLEVGIAADFVSGQFLFSDQLGPHPGCHPADEPDAIHNRSQVVAGCVGAFLEVSKFDREVWLADREK